MERSKSGPLGREMERLTKDVEEEIKIAKSEEVKKPKEQRKTVGLCRSDIYLRKSETF